MTQYYYKRFTITVVSDLKKKDFEVNAALNKCCGVKSNKYGTPQIKSRQLPSSDMFSLFLHLFHYSEIQPFRLQIAINTIFFSW